MKSTLNSIKFCFLIIFIIKTMETGADIRADCRRQTGVSWKSLKKLKAADFSQNDPKLKCYIKCYMKRNGIFGDKDVNIENAVRHLPSNLRDASRKALHRCKRLRSKDLCDRAFQLAKCYSKAQPEVFKSISMV